MTAQPQVTDWSDKPGTTAFDRDHRETVTAFLDKWALNCRFCGTPTIHVERNSGGWMRAELPKAEQVMFVPTSRRRCAWKALAVKPGVTLFPHKCQEERDVRAAWEQLPGSERLNIRRIHARREQEGERFFGPDDPYIHPEPPKRDSSSPYDI